MTDATTIASLRNRVDGDNAARLSDNPADDVDRRRPEPRGTTMPVPEC